MQRARRSVPAHLGFTVVEVVVVLGLTAGALVLLGPRIRGGMDATGGSAAQLAATLERTRDRAILDETVMRVDFDTIGGIVLVSPEPARATDERDPLQPAFVLRLPSGLRFGRTTAGPRPRGAAAVTFGDLDAGLPRLRFLPTGQASEAGTIYLTADASAEPAGPAQHDAAIEVERQTARIRCLRSRSEGWSAGC